MLLFQLRMIAVDLQQWLVVVEELAEEEEALVEQWMLEKDIICQIWRFLVDMVKLIVDGLETKNAHML